MALAQDAKKSGINYVLEAKYEGATNEQAAFELNAIYNLLWASNLYEDGKAPNADIVYEQNGEYLFRK
jgi:hypothetical protein